MLNFWESIKKAWCVFNFNSPEVNAYAGRIMEKEIRNGLNIMCLVLFVMLGCGAGLNFILNLGDFYLHTYLLLAALCLNIWLASNNTNGIQNLIFLGFTLIVICSSALVLLAQKTGGLSIPLATSVIFIFIVIPIVPWGLREALAVSWLAYFVFSLSTLSAYNRFDLNTLLLLQFFMLNAVGVAMTIVLKFTLVRKKEIKTIYDLEIAQKKLQELSCSDPLTGAWNRRYLIDRYVEDVKMHRESKRNYYFILADIDNFKKLNDTCGHDFGDEVLQLVVDSFKKHFGTGDNLIRMGGDEFVLIVSSQEPNDLIEKTINRINEHIKNIRKDFTEVVSISFGVILVSFGAEVPLKELYQKADKCLYTSKTEQGTSIHESAILSLEHKP